MSQSPDFIDSRGCMGIWDNRIDGPVSKEYDSFSKTHTFVWAYKSEKVLPFHGSLNPGMIIGVNKSDGSKSPVVVLERIEGLIFRAICGDQQFFVMEKQKKYMILAKRKEQE